MGDPMRVLLVTPFLFSAAAQAHDSVVPHAHPHDVSMLPGIETIVCGLLVLAAAAIAWKYRQTP